jgi:hypothetical protein
LVDGDLAQDFVVALCYLELGGELGVVGEHKDQLVFVGTFKEVEGHFDFWLFNLLFDVGKRTLK